MVSSEKALTKITANACEFGNLDVSIDFTPVQVP
jgi:hypothetical protein